MKNQEVLDKFRGKPCLVCSSPGEPDHIKSRGAGGTNEEFNLWSLCRSCHTKRHNLGFITFVSRHRVLQLELVKKGWVLGGSKLAKWIHPIYRQRSFERMKGKL